MNSAKDIGKAAARVVFRKRGNHSEAHLTEPELAAIIEAAVILATQSPTSMLADHLINLGTRA